MSDLKPAIEADGPEEVLFAEPAQAVKIGEPEPGPAPEPRKPEPRVKARGPGKPFWEIAFHQEEGKFYFALWSANGRLLMTSDRGYEKRKQAFDAIRAAARAAAEAEQITEAEAAR